MALPASFCPGNGFHSARIEFGDLSGELLVPVFPSGPLLSRHLHALLEAIEKPTRQRRTRFSRKSNRLCQQFGNVRAHGSCFTPGCNANGKPSRVCRFEFPAKSEHPTSSP